MSLFGFWAVILPVLHYIFNKLLFVVGVAMMEYFVANGIVIIRMRIPILIIRLMHRMETIQWERLQRHDICAGFNVAANAGIHEVF